MVSRLALLNVSGFRAIQYFYFQNKFHFMIGNKNKGITGFFFV